MSQTFLDAVFKGARFNGSELPVDVLQELAAYRELLVAVARHLFLDSHPNRQRVPRGFVDSLSLTLSGIRDGSTVATLSRKAPTPSLPDFEDDVFEPARDLIGNAIAAVNSDAPVPDAFPAKLLPLFNRLGRKLKEGDSIELRPEGAADGPRFSVETKRRILRTFQDEIEVSFVGYAHIAGVHMTKNNATLLLPDGREVPAEASSGTLSAVTAAVPQHEKAWLRFGGTASMDAYDRVIRVSELEDADRVDKEQAVIFDKMMRRLRDLEDLRDGWLDGEGRGLDRRTDVAWTGDVLLLVVGELALQKPGIFPTPDGHLQAEWSVNGVQITLRFDLDQRNIRVEAFNVETDEEKTADFKRSERDSAVEFIREQLGETTA